MKIILIPFTLATTLISRVYIRGGNLLLLRQHTNKCVIGPVCPFTPHMT